ncbi:MAG: RNA polymerase factor sigma-54 [Thermincola sp.]|nr:RNA polymerase factor sigma-54 [Thermincola sp.]MDT3704712.1 RNA polymerase factor sigma-54 [Thermincola sp.]
MRMGFRITQEQTQKLIMTPELRVAIKILQLSTVELVQYIDQQLIENPVLEVVEGPVEHEAEEPVEKASEKENQVDIDWEQYFEDAGEPKAEKTVNRDRENRPFDNFVTAVPNLHDHLLFQLSMANLPKNEWDVGEFLILSLDDNGYLQCSINEAAVRCGVTVETAEKILKVIQGFDPPGIAARDIRECLLIQYEQLEIKNELLKKLIENYLGELAEGKMMKVAKKLGVSLPDIQKAVDELKLLEPKPGRKFSVSDNVRYIVPDLVVERVDGEYIIMVNDVSAPRLTLNPFYKELVRTGSSDPESRKFLESKLNSAVWLMRSIEQRRGTLYKVARYIVDAQVDFFEKGIKYLKPMILKHVADATGLHESTVSRATSNKYMQTPKGLFELKFFFSSGISHIQGSAVSSEAVKKIIRELIDAEDSQKPLSDQKIADILQDKGMDISRRTVAKYRDETGILSSARRRRY